MSAFCGRYCRARNVLGQTITDGTGDTIRAEASLREMCLAYEESERATMEHIRKVRAILASEQKKRFDELLRECTCRECRGCIPGEDGSHCK